MTPTLFEAMFEINAAIVMVAAAFALFIGFRRSEAAASAGRLAGMMSRIGLDPAMAGPGEPGSSAIMNQVLRRCRKCPREDVCERWLAGSVEGDNGFCPNARVFHSLS